MFRMRSGVFFVVCIVILCAPYAYADDFGEGDVEPTTPVTGYSFKLSQPTPSAEPVVTPLPENKAPRAHAGTDLVVNTGALVVLNASMSRDPDGTIASYSWKQLSGPAVELLSIRTSNPSFFAGSDAASYVFQLTVKDNIGYAAIDLVTVVVRPGVVPSPSPIVQSGNVVTPSPEPVSLVTLSFSNMVIMTLAGILLLLVITVVKVALNRG